jgi:hypothetical protein
LFGERPQPRFCRVDDGDRRLRSVLHQLLDLPGQTWLVPGGSVRETARPWEGIGKALLASLAKIASNEIAAEWIGASSGGMNIDSVLRSAGAVPLSDWTTYRLTGESLAKLAQMVSLNGNRRALAPPIHR